MEDTIKKNNSKKSKTKKLNKYSKPKNKSIKKRNKSSIKHKGGKKTNLKKLYKNDIKLIKKYNMINNVLNSDIKQFEIK